MQRALAFARARERYPGADRETLLECCTAAWDAALEADSFAEQLTERFEGTLALLAWTHGWTRRPVDLHSLQRRAIPFAALRPFMAEGDAKTRLEKLADAELAPAAPPVARRPRPRLPRIPFVSPVPMGAAMAAGIVAVAGLNSAGAISLGPLDRSGGDGPADDEGSRPQAKTGGSSAAPADGGSAPSATTAASAAADPGQAGASAGDATVASATSGAASGPGIPAVASSLAGPPAPGGAPASDAAPSGAPAPAPQPASAAPAPPATAVVVSGGAPPRPMPVARPRPVAAPKPPSIDIEPGEEGIQVDFDPAPEPVPADDTEDSGAPEDESALPEASVQIPGDFELEAPEPPVGEPPVEEAPAEQPPGIGGLEDIELGDEPQPADQPDGGQGQAEAGDQPEGGAQEDEPQSAQQPQADQPQPQEADTPSAPAPTPAAPSPPTAPAPTPAAPAPAPAPAAPAPPPAPAVPAAPSGGTAAAPAPPAPPAG